MSDTPTYLGIYKGSVVDNNDPYGMSRVTALIPQVMADQVSAWCDPIWPTSVTSQVGDIIWVQFVNGDLTKPVYFSSEAVTADRILAGSITSDKLAANSITARELAADALTVKHTITGSLFQTQSAANRGIKIGGTENSLRAFNSGGTKTFEIDGDTGNVTMQGEFGTNLPGKPGVFISSPNGNGIYGPGTYPQIVFQSANTGSDRQAQVFSDTSGSNNLYLWSGASSSARMGMLKLDGNPPRARIGLESSQGSNEIGPGIDISSTSTTWFSSYAVQFATPSGQWQGINCGTINLHGNLNVDSTATISGNLTVEKGAEFSVNTGISKMYNGGSIGSDSKFQMVSNDASYFRQVDAAAFNVQSDRRMKKNIAPVSAGGLATIRDLPVYEYEVIKSDHDGPTYGVMAEDVPEHIRRAGQLRDKEVAMVDVYALLSVVLHAVRELDEELDRVPGLRKGRRVTRKQPRLDD